MHPLSPASLRFLQRPAVQKTLNNALHGIEKESLRLDAKGEIATTPHPEALGHKLTHPYLSTDFAESQLELITPPCKSIEEAYLFLQNLQTYLLGKLKKESLWHNSMPPPVKNWKQVEIADFGPTDEGKKKHLYRQGLTHRFGKEVQAISGSHYNFSLPESFFSHLKKYQQQAGALQAFINESYLGMIRNFLRFGFVNTYLFGASPLMHKSFLRKKNKELELWDANTYYMPYATSFRTSQYGYYSRLQLQHGLNFNDFSSYLKTLHHAIKTPHPRYEKIGLWDIKGKAKQLNTHILQIENEHYSRIRPKPKFPGSPYESLCNHGIGYVEVRTLDLDPFSAIGLDIDQLYFSHILCVYCLLCPSPLLSQEEEKNIPFNQNQVAIKGRNPKLQLRYEKKQTLFIPLAKRLVEALLPLAKILDGKHSFVYQQCLERQLEKIYNPQLTPSARLLADVKASSFLSYHLKKGRPKLPLSKSFSQKMEKLSQHSLINHRKQEVYEELHLKGYEDQELSTQLVIKEALKRRIEVELIDRKEGFVLLKKGKKEVLVKQATKTSLDSYLSFLIMENKHVSKYYLEKKGIRVPQGISVDTRLKALDAYAKFQHLKLVVKPLTTNFGIGISFVEKNQPKTFERAINLALQHSHGAIIEEFVLGKEYRFLVINYQLIAVCHRDPANIVGDGKNTIRSLVKEKNLNPENYKIPEHFICLGKEEKAFLKAQNLHSQSLIPKGKKVYLRENSNICTGGDPINVTSEIHESYKAIAIEAARAASAKFCGVDMMIVSPRKKAYSDNYAIVEINFNPALYMHAFPFKGEKVNVGAPVLDTLGFLT